MRSGARRLGSAGPSCENSVNSLFFPLAATHSSERHCGSVRSVPRGSFVGDTPRVLGCRMQCSERSTGGQGGLKSRPVSITRPRPHKSLIERVGAFSHAATDKSTAAAVAMPAVSILGRVGSCLRAKHSRNFAPVHQLPLRCAFAMAQAASSTF